MRTAFALLLGSLAFTASPAQAAPDPEAKLAKALEGRVAGEPVDCIDLYRMRGTTVINDTAIIYDAGRTLYVNRPRSGASSLDQSDILVTRTHTNRLCSIDTIQLHDRSTRTFSGVVFLDQFVPYRKVESASAD